MSRSLTITLVVTRPPASRQIRAATFSAAHPLFLPTRQPVSKLLGDGHEGRVESYTSSYARSEGEEGASDRAE